MYEVLLVGVFMSFMERDYFSGLFFAALAILLSPGAGVIWLLEQFVQDKSRGLSSSFLSLTFFNWAIYVPMLYFLGFPVVSAIAAILGITAMLFLIRLEN